MKVFDITTFYSTGRGGITTYLERKAQLSQRYRDIDHHLILAGGRDEITNFHGSTCHWVKSRACGWNQHYRYLLNYFKIKNILAQENPEIIETSDPYWVPIFLYLIRRSLQQRGLLKNSKLYIFYRVDFPDTYVAPFFQKVVPWLTRPALAFCWWFLRRLLSRMDGVLVHSEVMLQKLLTHGVRAPMHVVGNLTNFEPFEQHQPSSDFQKILKSRFGEVGPRLLFCGRLSPEKGLNLLLQTFAELCQQLPKAILTIVGDGQMRSQVAAAAADTKNRLHYIPATPDRTFLASIFSSCDLMVMPGPHETFSMVTLEAIVAGLPVVGVQGTGGIRALIKPGIGFLCQESNVEQMRSNIAAALEPRDSWYRDEVRQKIVEDYRPERVYVNLLKAYGVDVDAQQQIAVRSVTRRP